MRCDICKLRIRGLGHEDGEHHKRTDHRSKRERRMQRRIAHYEYAKSKCIDQGPAGRLRTGGYKMPGAYK